MKHLLPFRLFEARVSRLPSGLTPRQEEFLNRYTQGTWSVNPGTGLVDVRGNFDCSGRGFKSLQGVSFGHVSGYFSCDENQLTTLEGAPQTVGGTFSCNSNHLTTLEGAPQTVGGNFNCGNNQLMTLEGAPQTVGGDFPCYSNQLTTLAGAPQTVDGDFYCTFNQLTTLEGAPQTVDGTFSCDAFGLERGEWNPSGWVKILTTGNAAAQKLMITLPWLQPDWWNSELQRDPGNTVHSLASCWKHLPEDWKSKIKIPSGYENEFGLFSGFDELGLF